MAAIVPIFDPQNYNQVRQRIRKLWREGFTKIPGSHAWPRMQKRKIDITDVEHVINYGRIVDHSKPKSGGKWRFVLEGDLLDDPTRRIRCVVEINGLLIVVTVIAV